MLIRLVRAVMLLEDKSIGDENIKEEMEDILVKLPASSSTAIVPSHLISIYATHVLVVANDGHGACHFCPTTIILPS